ncbi:MAG: OmpA family protein [Bdellovibrionales bacterium]|nr:OmpA family protein [Bdellovibrionales bacterium]
MNNIITKLTVLSLVVITSGCVSASKHKELEDEHAKTQESLAACEAQKADLEKKLGVTSTEKSNLEGSVANMKRALQELETRRQETEKRLAEFREMTEKFKQLVDAGKLSIKVRNGRMMIALSTDVLFSSGSAKLSDEGQKSITEVTALLKDLKGRNYQIEGHTDNVPIKTKTYTSNWELASARATSVLNTMLSAGLPAERVSIASYGSFDPVADNNTKEGKAENRRIAIVVVPDLSGLPGFDELNQMSKQ